AAASGRPEALRVPLPPAAPFRNEKGPFVAPICCALHGHVYTDAVSRAGNAMNPDEVKAKLAAGQAATIASLRGLARGVARSHRPLPQPGPGAESAFGS